MMLRLYERRIKMTERQSSQATISSETLLRVSVLVFWFMLGVESFAAPLPAGDAEKSLISLVFAVIGFLGFGLAFWLNTGNIAFQSLGWRPVLLLAFQTISGFFINSDLLYIVAAEIPLVLPARAATIWIITQTLLLTAWIFWLDQTGQGQVSFMPLPQLPHFLVILITDIGVFAIHAFAFFMGYLAASEARGRRAAERINAELLATQDLLAQSSRIAERAFVARELHDALGHHLVALKVNLELAQHLVTDSSAKTPITDGLALVKRLLIEVRGVVSNVRTQPRIELRQAIQTLFTGITEISVELIFPQEIHIADPALAHALFRCVQEAITNTLKHARAHRLWIEFGSDQQQGITLIIRDDGIGASHLILGHGLNGMRERLESVGGTLDIAHNAAHGLAITARIPRLERLPP
jgi:signal transduction histidine kinase